jgi:hypothetical protein
MPKDNKQREYWKKLISYITACEDVIKDRYDMGESAGAEQEREMRLKNLTDNYILRKKPLNLRTLNLFPGQK